MPAGEPRRDAIVDGVVRAGRAAHPDLGADTDGFTRHVERRVAELDAEAQPAAEEIHAGDLYLAFACASGAPGAAERLADLVRTDVERVNANQRSLGLRHDELLQLVLERLLVRDEAGAVRIATYSGRGPLRAWVRVAATRIALDLGRKRAGQVETPARSTLFDQLPGAHDPEMAYMRSLYGAELQAAFEAAFTKLSARERTVLRQRFVEQLTGDAIATIHGVHRATVFGWIEDARRTLLGAVRSELAARVRGTDATLDSVMGLVVRGLDVSVGRLLGGGER
jgi:RNA polymerase sigma-70 factor (ECF subfamily)